MDENYEHYIKYLKCSTYRAVHGTHTYSINPNHLSNPMTFMALSMELCCPIQYSLDTCGYLNF